MPEQDYTVRHVRKLFGKHWYRGTVTEKWQETEKGLGLWHIVYEDGDQEDVEYAELSGMLTGQGETTCAAAPVDDATDTEDTSPRVRAGVDSQQTADTCSGTEQTPPERVSWRMAFRLNAHPPAAAKLAQHLMVPYYPSIVDVMQQRDKLVA